MCLLARLIRRFGAGYNQYADGTQLFLLLEKQSDVALLALSQCMDAEAGWLRKSWLKLNPSKTEVM